MPESTEPPHVSIHLPPGLSSFGDVKSYTTTSCSSAESSDHSEDENTLTAFGDISIPEEQLRSEIRCHNRLRLKVKRPPFPKNRGSLREGSSTPTSPTSPSSFPSPTSYSILIDVLKDSPRSSKRLAAQRSPSDAVELETPDRLHAVAEPTSSDSSSSSASCKPGHSMIVKAVPSVAEFPEQPRVWKKLPPRLPIPKWDVDE